ncbi:unnamed protein product [Hydatigera taeniaeformis]|uniref:Uncharacterized protein n=1 Tax=Hydatigena taeniaeformis TaxID=6205 RepID=A0A0R3WUP8_HYDTA|nr:unnamed protein product [Hydatigera taeniaeformis]
MAWRNESVAFTLSQETSQQGCGYPQEMCLMKIYQRLSNFIMTGMQVDGEIEEMGSLIVTVDVCNFIE